MPLELNQFILLIIITTLAAIVWSLRVLFLMEKRISRIDVHIEQLVESVLREEKRIEEQELKIVQEEKQILDKLSSKKTKSKK